MTAHSVRFSPEKLARLLLEQGITPYALAKQLGASQAWMQKLMAGRIRMPTDKYLAGIAEILEIGISDLLDVGQNEQEPQVLHENGLEYSVIGGTSSHTDPERLRALIRAIRRLPAYRQEALQIVIDGMLGGSEDVDEEATE